MNDSDAKKLLRNSRNLAAKKGYLGIAEDFAQFVVMSRLEGKSKPLKFHFVDFLRENYGRTGPRASVQENLRANSNREYLELRENDHVGEDDQHKVMAVKLIQKIVRNPFDKAVLNLSVFWELTALEIADVFDVSRYIIDKSLNRSIEKLQSFLTSKR